MDVPLCPVHGANCDYNCHQHRPHQSDHQEQQHHHHNNFLPSVDDCSNFLMEVKRTLPHETYQEFVRTAKYFNNPSGCNVWEVTRKIETVLINQPRLLTLFGDFLPVSERQRFFKSLPVFPRAFAFIYKVKTYFVNEVHRYHSFIAILRQIKSKTIQEIAEGVSEIFRNHNDLIEEFNSFLPIDSSDTDTLYRVSSYQYLNLQNKGETSTALAHHKKMSIVESRQKHILEDYEHSTHDKVDYQHDNRMSLTVVDCSGTAQLDRHEEDDQTSPAKDEDRKKDMNHEKDNTEYESFSESDSDKATEILGKVLPFFSTEVDSYTARKLYSKEEFSLKKAEICTPSYRFLPKNYRMIPASKRTILDASVLNDVVVSVTSGREDCSFKLMRRNQYEEILFKCEDDRYGLDMLLEMVGATVVNVEKLLEVLQDSKRPDKTGIRVQKYLTSRNLRCIESIYDDHGLDIVDRLCKNPGAVLPVVLTRLKQKQEAWTRSQSDFQKKWNDVIAKNYRRSLDHSGFYFKQQDAKNLTAKALLAGVKEMKKKRQKEDDALVARFIGDSLYEVPDMDFEYPDTDIHEDLYNIIEFSGNEFCSSEEQFDKVLTIWTSLLEHMFGVVPRPEATEPPQVDPNDERQDGDFPPVVGSCDMNDMGNEASTHSYETGEIHNRDGTVDKNGQRHMGSRTAAAEYDPDDSGSEFGDSNERVHKISDGAKKASEDNIEAENVVEGIKTDDTDDLDGNETPLSFSDPHFEVKPLNVHSDEVSNIQDYNSRIFYGNSSFYTLFRLHQTLYERIHLAKINLLAAHKDLTAPTSSNTVDDYAKFMNTLYNLIDGSIDNSEFEDKCCDTIRSQSYVLFTLNKLIQKIIKQLQAIASSDVDNQFLELYDYETSRERRSSYDLIYRKDAYVIHDKDLFRFVCSSEPVKLSIQSIDLGNREYPVTSTLDPDLETYLDNGLLRNVHDKEIGGIFLKRNIRKSLCDDDPSTTYGDMEGVHILNGLQCDLQFNLKRSIKSIYVIDTEDILFRERKKRKRSGDHISESTRKSQRFHDFLSRRLLIQDSESNVC